MYRGVCCSANILFLFRINQDHFLFDTVTSSTTLTVVRWQAFENKEREASSRLLQPILIDNMFLLVTLLILCKCVNVEVDGARWTPEQANAWYTEQPWYFGANYVPSSAVNEIDMWQTNDKSTMERELGWASEINMNIMRVFLHVLFYQQDAVAFYKKMDDFLTLADRLNIKIIFVLFDECWRPDPVLGPQPDPIPGQHNSQWVRCPGQAWLLDQSKWPSLKK